ncbi:AI-2E family transporter [Dermacoccaceae bacterium W4C1]
MVKRPDLSAVRRVRDRLAERGGSGPENGDEESVERRPGYRPGEAMNRWLGYREQQREALRRSYAFPQPDAPAEPVAAGTGSHPASAETADPKPQQEPNSSAYGPVGEALSRYSPFYLGFMAALGVAVAYTLVNLLGRLQTTLTILLIAFFLTLALNPIVEAFERRGASRAVAVLGVCAGLVGVFAILAWVVVPPLVNETTELINNAPGYAESFTEQKWVQDLDHDYQIGEKINEQVTAKSSDGAFVSQVFGGVLGAGRAVASGLFQAFTVLVLTLYFLSSLPAVKRAAYAMVPASRRARVISLSEEIMRRVGSYAIGQVLVASINGICSWVMMTFLGIPYAAVLAVVVGFLGLIPMVGATLGALIVALVAFFVDPQKALVVGIYYVIYQQIENYVIVPKIMQRTVSVPGAVTVVAALAGGTLLGVLGALLAIPVAAGLLLLYEEVLVPKQAQS